MRTLHLEHTAGLVVDDAPVAGRLTGAAPAPRRLGGTFSLTPFVAFLPASFSGSEASTSEAMPVSSPDGISPGVSPGWGFCGTSTSAIVMVLLCLYWEGRTDFVDPR